MLEHPALVATATSQWLVLKMLRTVLRTYTELVIFSQ